MKQLDSLNGNEFQFEIEGETAPGIFYVANLTTLKFDENGVRVKVPLEVGKMVERDGNNAFNKWLREAIDLRNADAHPTRTIAIVAVDDGVETRRWTLKGAWIQSVTYSTFDTASFEMVQEIYTIQYDDIEETWTATPDLE